MGEHVTIFKILKITFLSRLQAKQRRMEEENVCSVSSFRMETY
jgi:hypothetical protein